MNPLRLWWDTDDENVDRQARFDFKPLIVLLSTAVLLTVHEYFGNHRFRHLSFLSESLRNAPDWKMWDLAWWSGSRVLLFLVVPTAIILAIPGERLRDYGWSLRGVGQRLGALLVLVVALPILVQTLDLDGRWLEPTLQMARRSTDTLVVWSALVAAQIVAVEFFFRGFILGATRRSMGVHSVLAMMVPWCMFHYDKGQSAGLYAIATGILLGIVALRTRSIWPGVLTQAVATVLVLELWRP